MMNATKNKQPLPKPVINYMSGISYRPSAVTCLGMVAASGIRGEQQYYRTADDAEQIFDKAIADALNQDFQAVLDLAIELRKTYNMRLNPQVIVMAAALHPARTQFSEKNPKALRDTIKAVAQLPTDLKSQLDYYKEVNGSKAKLPGVVKRAWADWLEQLTLYHAAKYGTTGQIVDLIRIAHPRSNKNPILAELVQTGKVEVADDQTTWEKLRSAGKTWAEILDQIKVPHMALLRNLCGIARDESVDAELLSQKVVPLLQAGVLGGKQFPYRYWSAYKALQKEECTEKVEILLNAVETCVQISLENLPMLKGSTVSLCDNSGSAYGPFTSTYGSVVPAEIANLSGLLTALRSENGGTVGVFGDRLHYYDVNPSRPILTQLEEINALGTHESIGHSTENGIWIHFRIACLTKKHWDNQFIYSDMQAGHGELYGIDPSEYSDFIHPEQSSSYIDVLQLVETYRQLVYPKTNVFSVQVAGYNNSVLPENTYRTSVMQGWTGQEVSYAAKLISLWDTAEEEANTTAD